ncbi:MAG: hypothetical protein OIN88_12280 [Candidatus Methanoperedens sp.]|nr:hypothetical protein [Candidatus Methanoperedens sp.]MCZ7358563.1 hypothetical protein [Candidatus Methanoperedens sp.]HLB70015.1 hypothetical protein [Candidatus Methanoperedens sp.]
MSGSTSMLTFKVEIDRIGNVLDLDDFKVKDAVQHGKSTMISSKFYNKGVYRIRNTSSGRLENMAINIDKIAAVTYDGIVKELGEGCVDKSLWKDVAEGEPIFFYSLKLERDFVK